jgi:cytochrome c
MSPWNLPKLGLITAVATALVVGVAFSALAGQVAQKKEILTGPYFDTLKPGDSVEASITRGEKLFNELGCAGCHPRGGSLGEGVTAVDVTGNRMPIPIPDLRGAALHYPHIAGSGFVATLGMLNDL